MVPKDSDEDHAKKFYMKIDKLFALISFMYFVTFCGIFWSNYFTLQ